jgi:NADPH:quinone reductase-like Zn-dependent oxidoreductase
VCGARLWITLVGWEEKIRDVDVVFDTVGGKVLMKAWHTVQDEGIIIAVGDPAPAWAFSDARLEEAERRPGVRYKSFIVSPNAERLIEANALVDLGELKSLNVQPFPFDEAPDAWQFARRRGRVKKVVIVF